MSATTNQAKNRPYISKKASTQRQNGSCRIAVRRVFAGCCACGFKIPKISELSPLKVIKHYSCKMARALHVWRRPSSRVSSSGRSKSSIATTDTHRSAAIEDCIEFINSSYSSSAAAPASLPRSTSVSVNPS